MDAQLDLWALTVLMVELQAGSGATALVSVLLDLQDLSVPQLSRAQLDQTGKLV